MQDDDAKATSTTREIFAQHEHLRALLRMLDGEAERVIRAETKTHCDLPRLFELVGRAVHVHLAFEEALLDAADGGGRLGDRPLLARACGEHGRQRDELTRLTRSTRGADDQITLALEVRAFVSDLLLDMEQEDRAFGASSAVRV